MLRSLLFCAALIGFVAARAQQIPVFSNRFIGADQPDSCYSGIRRIISTQDKGYFFVGTSSCNGKGDLPLFPLSLSSENAMIGKLDSNLNLQWIKTYGGSLIDGAYSCFQSADGGYVVLCRSESNDGHVGSNQGNTDIWVFKVNAAGSLLWSKTYGSPGHDEVYAMTNGENGSIVILSGTNGSGGDVPSHYGGPFTYDWIVYKLDSQGSKKWVKVLGGTKYDEGYDILYADNGYYLIGGSESIDHDCTDNSWFGSVNTGFNAYLLRIDTAGNVLWNKSYGGSESDAFKSGYWDARDSSLMMTGFTRSSNYMISDNPQQRESILMVKTNKNGVKKWVKTINKLNLTYQQNSYVAADKKSGYIVGTTVSGPRPPLQGSQNVQIFAVDSMGSIKAQKIFGSASKDALGHLNTYSGGFLLAGATDSSKFNEGINMGRHTGASGNLIFSTAFISYLDYWPLDVNELALEKQTLKVYPNPAKEQITIDLPASNAEPSLKIISTEGKPMYSIDLPPGQRQISVQVAPWPKAIYHAVWRDAKGHNAQASFLLQ